MERIIPACPGEVTCALYSHSCETDHPRASGAVANKRAFLSSSLERLVASFAGVLNKPSQ